MNTKLFYSSVAFQHFAYGIIIPTLIIWQNQLGLSFTEIGFIQTIGIGTILLSEIPSSYFADRIGKKLTLTLAFVLTILSFQILITASSFNTFLLSQIFLSLGMAFFSGTQESYLHDSETNTKSMTKSLGKMSIVDESSTIIGIAVSSLIIQTASIKTSFLAGLIALIFGLTCTLILKNTATTNPTENPVKSSPKYYKKFSILIIIIFFSTLALRGEIIFQSNFSLISAPLTTLGIIYTIGKLFSILGSALAHRIEELLGFHKSMISILVLQIISFSFLLKMNLYISVSALCIYFFSENIFRNIRDSWILEQAPHNLRATFISTVSFSAAIFALAAKPIIGYSIDQAFYYSIILIITLKLITGIIFILKQHKKTSFT